jgi:Putative Ig domain
MELAFSRRLCLAAAIAICLPLFPGCGGGGGGGSEDLSVGFSYPNQQPIYVWNDAEVLPSISGLEGHTPQCHVSSGTLPAGMSLSSSTCAVTGAPTETGDFFPSITLSVDGFDGSVSNNLPLSVVLPELSYDVDLTPQPWGEAISPVPAHWKGYTAKPGDVASFTLYATHQLPAGLSVDPDTGEISGTPIEMDFDKLAGSVGIIANVERAGKSILVNGPYSYNFNPPDVVYPDVNGHTNQAFTQTPTLPTAMADGSFALDFQIYWPGVNCNGVSDLAIDRNTGVLTGTPTMVQPTCFVEIDWVATKGGQVMRRTTLAWLSIVE